ncbi:MAG: class I SAM-dependent rRNA methyltransferase [Planctomycetota bacterium]|jgi:23S rRNA (cytosine1962-C5)-methyltransferase
MRSVYLRSAEAPRNPRIFRKRLRAPKEEIRPGEVVSVRTSESRFVGRAFYSPRSVIAARILDREENGPPIDRHWFRARLEVAGTLRTKVLGLPAITDAWRVVHAEGDGLSGLVLDRYADIAVLEVGARGIFEQLDDLEELVREIVGVREVVVRADAEVEQIEGFRASDLRAAPARAVIEESGLRFQVDCRAGHKTGFFLDQRESRAAVAQLAKGRRVLDLCCYTGGFALQAARGGARSVLGVDLDETAVDAARRNAGLNDLRVPFEHADAFDFLREARAEADLIVLDPPKLAASRQALPRARRKSVDLNALALAALAPEGLLFTFSCTGLFSSEEFLGQVREAAARSERSVRLLRATGQPPDHPVHLFCPETRYLTGLLLQAE